MELRTLFQYTQHLSDKAVLLLLRLLESNLSLFTFRELQQFNAAHHMTGFSYNLLYAILGELETAGVLRHSTPAPYRPAVYSLTISESCPTTTADRTEIEKGSACDTLPNVSQLSAHDQQTIAQMAAQYGLTAAFLSEKVDERIASGKSFNPVELKQALSWTKAKATTDFAGYFFTTYVKRGWVSPYVAQESGQPPRQPVQDVTTPAARVNERDDQKTPYKSNMSVPENLRQPVKTAEEQTAHYQQIAAPIPSESRLAIDVRVLTSGLMAMKASVLAGKQSAAQARACVTELLGGFAPEVWQAAEETIQDVLRAFDAAGKPVQPGVPAKLASMARGIGARA